MSSQTVPWDSRIESEANRLRQEILLESDFECLKTKSKESADIEISTSPSSILDKSSVHTCSDSNSRGVVLEDKSIQVSEQDQWISDCEDLSSVSNLDSRLASSENYPITRSGNMYYKHI